MFPEPQAKLLSNSYIGELGRKYSRKDHGFTCSSLDTAQYFWTSSLAENRDVIIDSYQNPNTKQELFLIRERQIERIISDKYSKLIARPHIFEKHYRENFNPNNYTDYVGDGAIYFDGAGCGKTYRLCQKALAPDDPIILSFTNKAIANVKSVLCDVYNNYELAKKCYIFDLYFCDHHGRDISALEGKTIFVDEYGMTPNKWMTKLYQAFTKYKLTIFMFGDTNQCDPVEPTDMFYDYFKSVPISEMCP